MIILFVVSMFVGCCAILWFFWDRFKKPKKKIFISADCWLSVFDLLTPSQLGLGIAMISHRFDFYVDEHFKTRKWALGIIQIRKNRRTSEMEIFNADGPLPMPKMQLPRKVIGFKRIDIIFIDRNVIAFLHHFRQLFTSCPIYLIVNTNNDRIAQFLVRDIWPMFGKTLHGMGFSDIVLRHLYQFVPSILNDFPSLRFVKLYTVNHFADNAMASGGQAVTNWLFTPRPDNVPKVLKCWLDTAGGKLASKIETIKAAFTYASSPVNFIVIILIRLSFADSSILLFDLTNELTREQLALKRTADNQRFLLIRCPIVRNASKWTKWEEEAIDWANELSHIKKKINILITNEDNIGDGLLDANPGTSDQRK